MLERLIQIFDEIQSSRSTHNKYMRILMGIYVKSNVDEFVENFILILRKIFEQDIDKKNVYIKRSLEFSSKFSAKVISQEVSNKNAETQQQAVFLPKLLEKVFPFCDLDCTGVRYHSCLFISQLLNYIDEDVNLNDASCNMIQEAMLKRLEYEHSLDIRLQAVTVLSKFQCTGKGGPIIDAYLKCLDDEDNVIRRSVMDVISVNDRTVPTITEKLHDVDVEVRCKIYIRLGYLGPFVMDIIHGLSIMNTGLNEKNPEVKRIFKEELLNKWLMSYNFDYIKFLKAITLSLSEMELFQLASIGKKILFYLFESAPIDSLLECLPIDIKSKLIKDEHFNNETVLYWYCLIKYFHNDNRYDNYLHQIVPNLTQFCLYIERIFKEKKKFCKNEIVKFEFNIHCLLKIFNGLDFSEEVERQTTITLITNIITKHRFSKRKLIEKFVKVLSKCYTELDAFLECVREILTNIRETTTEIKERSSEREIMNRKIQIANCLMHMTILEIGKTEFIQNGNRQGLSQIQTQIDTIHNRLKGLEKQCGSDITANIKTIRVEKTDDVTVCYWLDISIGVMRLNRINKLSAILITFLVDLLLPLADNENDEIHSRYLECLLLYCMIDKSLALTHYQEIFEPIITFKKKGYSNLASLRIALIGFADLLCLYGTNLIKSDNCANSVVGKSTAITFPLLLDSAVAILDVEDEKIVITTLETLSKLVKIITFTSEIISRMLLKWFNPLMKKKYGIYKAIEFFIETFIKYTKNAIEIIRESIVPVLSAIVTSPNDDSVSSIDFETVLNFFVTRMNTENEINLKASVFDIIEKISDDSNKKIVELLSKILLRLNVTVNNIEECDQYVNPVEIIMNEIEDKMIKQSLEKFVSKVKNIVIDNELQIGHNDQKSGKKVENEINNNNNVEYSDCNENNNTSEQQITGQENQNKASNVGETKEVVKKKKNRTPAQKRQLKRKNSQ